MAMANCGIGLSVICLILISVLPRSYGDICGHVKLNERSIVLVGEVKSENRTNSSHVLIIRVLENVYGETSDNEVNVSQVDKARSCGKLLAVGDQRIFVIETRPGNKKYTLTSSLPLALKHLAVNARRGRFRSIFILDIVCKQLHFKVVNFEI